MEEITQAAGALGKLIAQSPAFQRLRMAEETVQADADARKTLEEFERQRRKIEQLEGEHKPVEVDDKHLMQRLSAAVHSSDKLQELMRAQADYIEMMNRVNKAIRAELAAP